MQKKIQIKPLVISLLVTLGAGILPNLFIWDSMQTYKTLNLPPLAPPFWLFPVIWTILYILMGISIYLIYIEESIIKKEAIAVYSIQLALNALWPLIFFKSQAYLAAFIWLVILWIIFLCMIFIFKKIRRLTAWLQIPYLLWATFAGYLNFFIWYSN